MKTRNLFLILTLLIPQFLHAETLNDNLSIGRGNAADKKIIMKRAAGNTNPGFKWDESASKMKFTHDGTTYKTFNLGTDIDSGAATSGQVPTANGSGGTTWATPSRTIGVTTKTANYTATSTDDLILCDTSGGAFTITLPASSGGGKVWQIRKTTSDFTALTIQRNGTPGTDTIVDTGSTAASTTINTIGETVEIVDYGSGTFIVRDRRIPSGTISYTPTVTGFGSHSSLSAFYKRQGDSLEVFGYFIAGTLDATTFGSVSLPTNLSIDTNKVPVGNNTGQPGHIVGSYASSSTAECGNAVTATATSATVVYFSDNFSGNATQAAYSTASTNNSSNFSFRFKVPISGWNY